MNRPVASTPNRRRRRRMPRRRGMALVLAMFIVIVSSITTVAVMETLTSEIAALNNAVAYERALYLANAGVHAAAAELEADATWRGTLTEGLFPADDAYTVTAVSGANSTVTVTAQGAAGSVVRTVVAVIEL